MHRATTGGSVDSRFLSHRLAWIDSFEYRVTLLGTLIAGIGNAVDVGSPIPTAFSLFLPEGGI